MSDLAQAGAPRGLLALRRLASAPPEPEHCALCGSPIADEHPHLVDTRNRRLLCACQACSILFDDAGSTQYRRVPRDVRLLAIDIDDAFWNALAIPVGLVFFFRSSSALSRGVLAVYPSPAGPTETTVDEDLWSDLAALHPTIGRIRTDVEALLANRVRDQREYFLVPIDECYKLGGLIRRYWRGFAGGEDASRRIEEFFSRLRRRALPERESSRA